jgi:hypothetical protein
MATRNRGHGKGGVDEQPDGRLVARIMIDGKRHAHYVKTRQEGYSWLAKHARLAERRNLDVFVSGPCAA